MTDQHPITPPRELVEQWASEKAYDERDWLYELHIAARAAQWAADQELEACAKWVEANFGQLPTHNLHQFRRPKPPSLKERALQAWAAVEAGTDDQMAMVVIRRALELLND